MAMQNKTFTGITIVASLLATIAALFAAYLLAVGQQWIGMQETYEGSTRYQVELVSTAFYPPAIPMLLSALALFGGLVARKLWVAWMGWVALGILSLLFLFSSGAALIPIDMALLILLIALTVIKRQSP